MSIQREQILNCARDLYLDKGIEGLSMRKLADCVGCTAPAIYRHYANKEEVMQDLVGEAYRLFAEYLYRSLEAPTPLERFLRAGRSYVDFALEQPALYEIIYVPTDVLGVTSHTAAVGERVCAIGQFWSDRVREMIDAGFLKEGDPYAISLTLWAHAHGLVSIYHRDLLPMETSEEFGDAVAGSFLRMMEGVGTSDFREEMEKRKTPGGTEEESGLVAGTRE
jgi:AcrR family transcriptional regulator